MQVPDPRHARVVALGGLVDRRQVMEVEEVGLPRPGGGELAPPGLHLVLERRVVQPGEHAVGRSLPVLERRVVGRVGRERVRRRGRGVEVEGPHVESREERARVRRRAGRAERAARERDVPAGLRERAGQVARDLARPAPGEEHQSHHDARHRPHASAGRLGRETDEARNYSAFHRSRFRPGQPGDECDGTEINRLPTQQQLIDRTPQTIVGTLPPSTDQAAPVTFEAELGAEERDHRGDLVLLPHPADRRLGVGGGEDLVAGLAGPRRHLGGEPALAGPELGGHRPGGHGVHQHGVARELVREHPAEREQRGLRDRVGGVRERGALAGRGAHVHDPPSAGRGHRRGERTHEPQRRHHVELPLLLPLLVRLLVERPDAAGARVVHQRPRRLAAALEQPLACVRGRHVQLHVGAAPRHGQHARALLREHARGGRADAARGARDHAEPAFETEIHVRG